MPVFAYCANAKPDVAPCRRRRRRCCRCHRDRAKATRLAADRGRQLRLFPGLMKIRLHTETLHLLVPRKRVNVTKRDSAANELGMKRVPIYQRGGYDNDERLSACFRVLFNEKTRFYDALTVRLTVSVLGTRARVPSVRVGVACARNAEGRSANTAYTSDYSVPARGLQ